ncbi:MAG: methylenetetrahydrofolate reductase C-terminal domain-containing protein, partial [Candidatus Omnitrophica bacterium]|nr:methylenetetrahydrofolate reductase C-terminal domain-containing protein [Candidatus Omnitrophota bacterium]
MGETTVIDYTKYRLKNEKEIREILDGIPEIFVLSCRKCYKEFTTDNEPECGMLKEMLENSGTKIINCESVDFLCNNHLTGKILRSLSGNVPVAVISCGLGIQFAASECAGKKRKVIALADSIPQSGNATSIAGYHGIALEKEKCAACGQCYLEKTGGICPIVDCAKSLVNGPCGGADKDGKCEVNKELPCAWVEIYKRLQTQKRGFADTVEIRNYDVFRVDEKQKTEALNRNERIEGFYGGVHPPERKEETEAKPLEKFPAPKQVFIFLSQHTGLPAKPVVKAGDNVKMGQKTGESAGFISSPVHSSVSGRVTAVEEKIHPVSGKPQPAIVIENDGLDTPDASIKPLSNWENIPNPELLEILRDKGIVGLGGAMFPSSVKLCPPKPVDTLIINGCECEPYLNADNRLMIERPLELLKGIGVVQKLLCVKKVVFAIEDNKREAMESVMRHKENFADVEMAAPKTKYPQGAEKTLIKKLLDREVPEGGLPFDVGAVVLNTGTVYSIYRAVYEGMPLIERVVTAGGDNAAKSGNFIVRIGTPFADMVRTCFAAESGEILKEYELKMGGPMMGIVQAGFDSAVIKGTTGLLL